MGLKSVSCLQLAQLHNLQKLSLAPKQELRVEGLSGLSCLTQLTSLAIHVQVVSLDLISSLMHLKLLRELDISNSEQVRPRAGHRASGFL